MGWGVGVGGVGWFVCLFTASENFKEFFLFSWLWYIIVLLVCDSRHTGTDTARQRDRLGSSPPCSALCVVVSSGEKVAVPLV